MTDLFPEEDKTSFKAAFTWWEKRRLRYNLILGITGLLVILTYGVQKLNIADAIFIFFVAVVANLCYCFGYLAEFFLKHYFNSTTDFADRRNSIFWIGTICSVLILLAIGFLGEVTH